MWNERHRLKQRDLGRRTGRIFLPKSKIFKRIEPNTL